LFVSSIIIFFRRPVGGRACTEKGKRGKKEKRGKKKKKKEGGRLEAGLSAGADRAILSRSFFFFGWALLLLFSGPTPPVPVPHGKK